MIRNKRRYRSISKKKNNNKINYVIIFFIITMIILGVIFIKLGLDFEKGVTSIYSYTAEKSDDYVVLLKPNTFYASETLPSGGYYASQSVKDYIVDFKYEFKGDRKADLEYNYSITADLVGTVMASDNQNKEVWTRTFILLENNNKQLAKEGFSINEHIDIDYENYNNLTRSYARTYGITIDSVLKLRLNVYYNISISELGIDTENIEDYIELDIPITNTVTEVKENYENTTSNDIIRDETFNIMKVIYLIIGLLFILVAVIVTIIRINKNKKTPIDMYTRNINRILKYYKYLIVTVDNEPNLSNLKVMNIALLEDLIDVAEQTKSNIIHYEVLKNQKSNLYVIVNEYVYIYVVTDSELK